MNASLSLLVVSVLLIRSVAGAGEPGTNLVSIYLVDRPNAKPWPRLDAASLKDLKLVAPPVLADSDFVTFDNSNHTFVITAEASKRLARLIWDLGKEDAPGWGDSPTILCDGYSYELIPTAAPFVLEAVGERVYAGIFDTPTSSEVFSGPVIRAEEPFIKTNVPKNATFSFSIQLEDAGPFPSTLDPRGDSRVGAAVRKLFADER